MHRCLESTVREREPPSNKRLANYEKIKRETEGWPYSKEYKKRFDQSIYISFLLSQFLKVVFHRQALIKLMKEQEKKKEKIEELSKHEMELDLKRKNEIIEKTEELLRFDTQQYKDIHRGMLLAEVLKERDIAKKLAEENAAKEKASEFQEEVKFIERIEREKEKDLIEKAKKKDFEKEWDLKREEQRKENKLRKERDFKEEVEDYHRRIEIMKDEIKREKKLQEIEKLERTTKFKDQLRDLTAKREQKNKEQKEDDEAFEKMYKIQDIHAERKKDHELLEKARIERISERQNRAINYYGGILSKIKDDTEERNKIYNDQVERKLFDEQCAQIERDRVKAVEAKAVFEEAQREKALKKQKEKEAILQEREIHVQKLSDVHEKVRKRKEDSEAAQKKLNKFWSNQKKELADKRRSEIEEDKQRLNFTLKG